MTEEQNPYTCTQPSCRLEGRCNYTSGMVCTLLNATLHRPAEDRAALVEQAAEGDEPRQELPC